MATTHGSVRLVGAAGFTWDPICLHVKRFYLPNRGYLLLNCRQILFRV